MPAPAAAHLAFPVLIADIGGTNARFAIIQGPESEIEVFPFIHTAGFGDPVDAILSLGLADKGIAPRSAVMAIAGPVTSDEVPLTNCDWTIRPRDMIARLGLERVILLNDFEALALALPSLAGDDVRQIGGGPERPNAAKVVIGPGTGLGVATLIHAAGLWIPVPGEGGHVDLGPSDERETAIWARIERLDGRVSAEHILSGAGLLRLARAVAATDGVACPHASPEQVTDGAARGEPIATETVTIFARALGRVAGDFALVSLARGGVYLGGGVSLKLESYIVDGPFREAFEAKSPHRGIVSKIPAYLIKHPRPALLGLAAYARAPGRFALELEGRSWQG